jgi:hypothetical protein
MYVDPTITRSVRSLAHLAPETIQQRLGGLMCRYVHVRSPRIAGAVARYLEALCQHPDFCPPEQERCVYRRLAREWLCLAANP